MQELERLEGRHAVLEALKAGLKLEKVLVQKDLKESLGQEVKEAAKAAGIPVQFLDKEKLDGMSRSGRHQGIMLRRHGRQ